MAHHLDEVWSTLFQPTVIQMCYTMECGGPHIAIADLTYFDGEYSLSRINVPEQFRGQGYGSKLLKEVLAKIDAHHIELWLAISPSGGLTHRQLEAWYRRYGFESHLTRPGVYSRKARSCQSNS